MRVQKFVAHRYGLVAPVASRRPMPTPSPFAGFGGEWEDWCDRNYYSAEWNEKCKECNRVEIPFLGKRCTWPDPKTMAGRAARGLPLQTDLERLGPLPVEEDEVVVTIPEAGGGAGDWFERNKTVVFAVGGVAALGILALAFRGGRRRMNGLAGFLGFGGKVKRSRRRKARRN